MRVINKEQRRCKKAPADKERIKMTFAEMTEITNQRLCTIEFEGKHYKVDLKTQAGHKKFAGKAYEIVGKRIGMAKMIERK